jgi:hypothetical protein
MCLINSTVVREIQIDTYLLQYSWTMPPNVDPFLLLSDLN